MPLLANLTSIERINSQEWFLIGTEGDVKVSCPDAFNVAFTPNTTAPAAGMRGHPTQSVWDGSYMFEARLEATQYLWAIAKDRNAAELTITATNPA